MEGRYNRRGSGREKSRKETVLGPTLEGSSLAGRMVRVPVARQ